MANGTLWLIPTPLDFGTSSPVALNLILPQQALIEASRIQHWIVENAKTARAVLKRYGEVAPLCVPLQQMQITELPHKIRKQGDSGFDAKAFLQAALNGHDMGLMSEAGLPAIADPGASVVRAAHDLTIPVVPLIGPSSLILALMSSGLNGQNFAFTGYLPTDMQERKTRIKELEKKALKHGQTQLFIETPYRNEAMLEALIATLSSNVRLAAAFGLTLPNAWQASMSVSQWKKQWPNPEHGLAPGVLKLPAVFAIGQ